MKLDTATGILEWAHKVELRLPWGRADDSDTATAERLAYCVRVTEIVEHDNSVAVGEFITSWAAKRILAEAAQSEGK